LRSTRRPRRETARLRPRTSVADAKGKAPRRQTKQKLPPSRGVATANALARRQIRGAALDVMVEEPLPPASPLRAMEHVLITPHTAGETCRYEDNVLAIMQENLARLWRGETELLNRVV
jgi:D-2-hydroxyacid dehydrogenase (NADP+)